MKPMETERLIIRAFTMEDAEDLQEILGDEETMKNCEPAYDFSKTKAFLQAFCIDRSGAVAAMEKQSRKVIGYLLFSQTEPDVYEMGWFFHRSFWRQGYAYEACKALLNYAFRELGARKVVAETIDGVKSVGLMKKLGMRPEGIDQTQDLHGNWVNLCIYSLRREDWERP